MEKKDVEIRGVDKLRRKHSDRNRGYKTCNYIIFFINIRLGKKKKKKKTVSGTKEMYYRLNPKNTT